MIQACTEESLLWDLHPPCRRVGELRLRDGRLFGCRVHPVGAIPPGERSLTRACDLPGAWVTLSASREGCGVGHNVSMWVC